jgi:hypothetical protein
VINDLHTGNMAVMPDGHAVTFDYDKLCTHGEFEAYVGKIRANTTGIYDRLPQYAHIRTFKDGMSMDTLTKISDILAVLAAVEEIATTEKKAINVCRKDLWTANGKEVRREAINRLKNSLRLSKGGRRTPRRRLPQLL